MASGRWRPSAWDASIRCPSGHALRSGPGVRAGPPASRRPRFLPRRCDAGWPRGCAAIARRTCPRRPVCPWGATPRPASRQELQSATERSDGWFACSSFRLTCPTLKSMLKRVWILFICLPALLPAALLRIEVSERTDVLDGKPFASAGPYERIVGKAYFAVDPNLPANKIIADIAKAPRNEDGLVPFSADFYCLKPRDPQHGNHAVLFEVSNRGGKGMLGMFDQGGSSDPRTEHDFGDGFLLEQGY